MAFRGAGPSFCGPCGALLPRAGAADGALHCLRCGTSKKVDALLGVTRVSQSREYAFQKPKFDTKKPQGSMDATIDEQCPKCGRPEMTFTTAQLRSADEGQTIFYSCKCGYTYSVNS